MSAHNTSRQTIPPDEQKTRMNSALTTVSFNKLNENGNVYIYV